MREHLRRIAQRGEVIDPVPFGDQIAIGEQALRLRRCQRLLELLGNGFEVYLVC